MPRRKDTEIKILQTRITTLNRQSDRLALETDPPHRRSAFRRVKAHSLRSTTITKEFHSEQSKSQPERDMVNRCQILYRYVHGPETGRGRQERLGSTTDLES